MVRGIPREGIVRKMGENSLRYNINNKNKWRCSGTPIVRFVCISRGRLYCTFLRFQPTDINLRWRCLAFGLKLFEDMFKTIRAPGFSRTWGNQTSYVLWNIIIVLLLLLIPCGTTEGGINAYIRREIHWKCNVRGVLGGLFSTTNNASEKRIQTTSHSIVSGPILNG